MTYRPSPHSEFEHLFVVLRIHTPCRDTGAASHLDLDSVANLVAVTRVFEKVEDADAEVERLNELNGNDETRYLWSVGRFLPKGS